MAIGQTFIIDAVTHAFDSSAANAKAGRYAERVLESNFLFQWNLIPDPYRIPRERYFQPVTSEALASALFIESPVDVAFYHTIPAWGVFHDLSPIAIGMKIRERHPGRMFLYGAVSPLEGRKAIEDLRRQAGEWDIRGIKLYPVDIIDGQMRSFTMSDRDLLYPVLEECLKLGIGVVAIHKAIPLGTAPMDPFRPGDIDYAARDFPELSFEIVHGGVAFLEETAQQVGRFENVYVNLEVSSQFVVKHPAIFGRIIGELLLWGGGKKIFWGTGCSFSHPKPVIEAFMNFKMPKSLVEEYGYPEVTDDIKADILGRNFAAVHALDLPAMASAIGGDELAERREAGGVEPWDQLP